MALTISTTTVRDVDVEFIEVNATEGLVTAGLSAVDMKALEDVDANGTGANLKAKMDGYALITNGQDALKTYGGNIVVRADYAAMVERNVVKGRIPSAVVDLRNRVDTLETT